MTGQLGQSSIPQAFEALPVYTDSLWLRVNGRSCQEGKWSNNNLDKPVQGGKIKEGWAEEVSFLLLVGFTIRDSTQHAQHQFPHAGLFMQSLFNQCKGYNKWAGKEDCHKKQIGLYFKATVSLLELSRKKKISIYSSIQLNHPSYLFCEQVWEIIFLEKLLFLFFN